MSDVVLDFIAAEIAALTKLVPAPTGNLGYGTDLSCTTDLTETMDETDPDSPRGIAELLIRRLDTARGTLPDDPDFGYDLVGCLNKVLTAQDLLAMPGIITREALQDDRIASVAVKADYTARTKTLDVSIAITPQDPTKSTFTLILAVTDGELMMKELSA